MTEYFEGSVKIDFKVLSSTNQIVLHVDPSIQIKDQIGVYNQNNNLIQNVANLTTNYKKNQFYQISLNSNLAVGNYFLTMNFYKEFGSLSILNGFYRSRYTEEGIRKTVLATNFQPVDARKAL